MTNSAMATAAIEANQGYGDLQPAGHAVLSAEQREFLQKLGALKLPAYLEEKLLDEGKFADRAELAQAFTEFKRYVALTRIAGNSLGMPSPKVDAVWHQFILFTPFYHKFCQEYLGEYLHHLPETSHTRNPAAGGRNFVRAYQEVFGHIPEVWQVRSPELLMGTSDRAGGCCTTQGCSPSCTPCSTF